MVEQYVGYTVSVTCRNDLGSYQGQISSVDREEQTITLKKAFKNGIPYHLPEVKLRGSDINNLSIIEAASDALVTGPSSSTVAVKKPVPKRAGRSVSESLASIKGTQMRDSPRKSAEDCGVHTPNACDVNRTPSKKDRFRQRWSEKDEACFGTPIDNIIDQDFDFEKNLALFNKQAVYDEINAQRPDIVRHADTSRRSQKYRHDQNVIESTPAMYRQVVVPTPGLKEYVTDDGLVIPSVTPDTRHQLLLVAERLGLTEERQAELMGRAATEMALQLLGGGHRLNPHNVHQWPTVVSLCGSHRQGAIAVNCARQLASHGVKTVVFLLDPTHLTTQLTHELALFRHTNNKLITTVQELPTVAVDLIVLALAGEQGNQLHQARYRAAAEWANENRAPVLALDPPPAGTPGVDTKFSLVPLLPLAHSLENGKIYLCNLAFPLQVFREVGIEYSSPFGPKFVIPLHPNDT
ncbi:enhancer of mRNA-decapping protein 3 [Zootermopsis nevadensis]|uniref:Enhancer of mRNA-decapping protein 3 n=1 Tax=Zootermopsis nevadensis TaxID=136037 RepID=A0A067R114_ZOONE|nr:enhancer of mRNA-decapping protein 3 [Zootermopsis nevadensis]KDR11216.1 Enhancer of mRNA-decapping protein 3 [Zootermopsis nevadensis]